MIKKKKRLECIHCAEKLYLSGKTIDKIRI